MPTTRPTGYPALDRANAAHAKALERERAASPGCYDGARRVHSYMCPGNHPRYAVVTALGCYSGPDTYVHEVHGVFGTLPEAQRYAFDKPRLSIVEVGPDETYMVPGYRFPLTHNMLVRKSN